MTPVSASSAVRQRITDVAFKLFYTQGYRATGINQIIAESGVAKASFYDHFPAKDDLLLLYARHTCDQEINDLRAQVLPRATARERFFSLLEVIVPWLESTDYRGCPFQNLVAELSADYWRIREISQEHRENIRHMLLPLASDLLAELKPARPITSPLTAEFLTDTYLVLLDGAIMLCVTYRQPWPIDQAIKTLKTLLKID